LDSGDLENKGIPKSRHRRRVPKFCPEFEPQNHQKNKALQENYKPISPKQMQKSLTKF
jgi:hypothetical protein